MKRIKNALILTLAVSVAVSMFSFSTAIAEVSPEVVDDVLNIGDSMVVNKTVTTPEIPTVVDVCLLEDETASFGDDIANLQGGTTASDIFDAVTASSPGANFAVAGFRDYPVSPYGSSGDWVYRTISSMSSAKADWLSGIAGLTAGGGNDIPEAQYDAIVASTVAGGCGWRSDDVAPGVQRILVVTTDAPFHTPDGTHVNSQASTLAALNAAGITVVGLKAPGSGSELDALAAATGGSVQALSSDGSNIASAIINGIKAVTTDVWFEVTSVDAGLNVSLTPAVHYDVLGDSTVYFTETISVDNDPALRGSVLQAVVTFLAGDAGEEGSSIGVERIRIVVPTVCSDGLDNDGDGLIDYPADLGCDSPEDNDENDKPVITLLGDNPYHAEAGVAFVDPGATAYDVEDGDITANIVYGGSVDTTVLGFYLLTYNVSDSQGLAADEVTRDVVVADTTAPKGKCVPGVNPSGKNIPPSANKKGENNDGFYELLAKDSFDTDPVVYVVDSETGVVFGPFPSGTMIKYTEANGGDPRMQDMTEEDSAVDYHIFGKGDMIMYAQDASGNVSEKDTCLVPPPPK